MEPVNALRISPKCLKHSDSDLALIKHPVRIDTSSVRCYIMGNSSDKGDYYGNSENAAHKGAIYQ